MKVLKIQIEPSNEMERPPTKEDGDVFGTVLALHETMGWMPLKWDNVANHGSHIVAWARFPEKPAI